MPIHGYSLLTGRTIDMRRGSGQSPHFQVQVSDDSDLYRLAINVESKEGSEVLYLVEPHFDHPILVGLADLKPGLLPCSRGQARSRSTTFVEIFCRPLT